MSEPRKKVVRHAERPSTLAGWLWYLRLTIARRIVQLGMLALFIGTARLGWTLFGEPLVSGDLSASLIAGTVPLADPFSVLQKLLTGHRPELTMIVGAAVVLAFYIVAGGRAFCAWMCPMNIVTDAAELARAKLGIKSDMLRVSTQVRYGVAIGCLAASAVTGTAAFDWISPQAFLWREAVWGIGLGFVSAVLGIFALDLLVVRRGWCGHICPLGAFWSAVGTAGIVRPLFDAEKCTRCADCIRVCPEPQIINFKTLGEKGLIAGGECTACGRCVAICPEKALTFGVRFSARRRREGTS